jgi:hypothetical protein
MATSEIGAFVAVPAGVERLVGGALGDEQPIITMVAAASAKTHALRVIALPRSRTTVYSRQDWLSIELNSCVIA